MTTAAKQHQTINSGYAYCVGIDYFGRKEPCKSCRRMFSFNFPTETGLTWIQPQYDETTGKCPFYDAKTDNDNFNNNNEKMKIRFKKLNSQAVTPKRAHNTDAGFDLTAVSKDFDRAHGCIVYGTGIAVEIPSGYMGLVFPRSSIADHAQHLTNSVGVIDAGYRGEIKAKFCPTVAPIIADQGQGAEMYYNIGERIAQLIILPIPEIEFEEVDNLSDSDRGNGGYGSTGK